jgi:hypothetical protein
MAPVSWTRRLPGALAAAAGAGALLSLVSGESLVAVALLLCCLGALVLRRTWIASEQEYTRARAEMRAAGLREEQSIRIERKELWVGETAAQLRDALGEPEGVDVKQLKTRTREVWKYGRTGRNRYSTRITLDNGTVVRWQRRDPAPPAAHPS